MLGNTVAINGKSVDMTAFGETENTNAMFTGKPHVAELGYAFLFRNYDSSLGKWSTSDPLGYPDGWNNFAYGNNNATLGVDQQGTEWIYTTHSMTFSVNPITVRANGQYEEVYYIGLCNGGNRGVAILNSATYSTFRMSFPQNITVPTNIISNDWYNISAGTRTNIIMSGWDDGGLPDNRKQWIGTDGNPREYWFRPSGRMACVFSTT